VTAKFVPKLLNFQQKQHRVTIAEQMLTDVADDSGLAQTQKKKIAKQKIVKHIEIVLLIYSPNTN